jgi:hypothetical protein
VCCFNHTLQLSAKTLLRLFNSGLGKGPDHELMATIEAEESDDTLLPDLEAYESAEEENELLASDDMEDDADDNIDELEVLGKEERDQVIQDTAVVRSAVSRLRALSFVIIKSTTLA